MPHSLRLDLGGTAPAGRGTSLLSVLHLSDAHVIDTVSPARCEWVEVLAHDPRWQPLLHMHRPYEALAHWTLAAHVDRARRTGMATTGRRPFDLAISTGDNIDNAQHNELDTFLRILAGGTTRLSAVGGVHAPSAELGTGPWPFWCPDAQVDDVWKPRGYAAVDHFIARASAELTSRGLGFAWASLPGNHDLLRQGTALPGPAIEAIAVGSGKALAPQPGFLPADALAHFVHNPAAFSAGPTRQVAADSARVALDRRAWVAAHVAHGAAGLGTQHAVAGCADAVIDTEHARTVLLDTNHPGGDFEGSIGMAQLAWLEDRLAEVDAEQGHRFAVVCSHHGSVSLTNMLGNDPERRHAAELTALLHRHPCVLAWLVGHRHVHRITPQPGPRGGFWEITTGSLIDWPCQTRAIEFVRHHHGTMEIVCTLQDHGAAPGSLAALHLDMARRFAGPAAAHMQGEATDGNVRLIRP